MTSCKRPRNNAEDAANRGSSVGAATMQTCELCGATGFSTLTGLGNHKRGSSCFWDQDWRCKCSLAFDSFQKLDSHLKASVGKNRICARATPIVQVGQHAEAPAPWPILSSGYACSRPADDACMDPNLPMAPKFSSPPPLPSSDDDCENSPQLRYLASQFRREEARARPRQGEQAGEIFERHSQAGRDFLAIINKNSVSR